MSNLAVKRLKILFSFPRYSWFLNSLAVPECVKWGQNGCVEPRFGTLSSPGKIGEELGAESGRFWPVFHPISDPLRTPRGRGENSGHTFQIVLSMELENRFSGPHPRFSTFSQTLLPAWGLGGVQGRARSFVKMGGPAPQILSPISDVRTWSMSRWRTRAAGGFSVPGSLDEDTDDRRF